MKLLRSTIAMTAVGCAVAPGIALAARSASTGAREACNQAAGVSKAQQKAKRCVQDDTKERSSPPQRLLAGLAVGGPFAIGPLPDDPFSAQGNIDVQILPAAASDSGTVQFSAFAVVDGVTGPGMSLDMGASYTEPFSCDAGCTLRCAPHQIYPGTYAAVSLTDHSGAPLATRQIDCALAGAAAEFSVATPGVYGIALEFWWSSGGLPPGGSAWATPPLGLDVWFTDGAFCPADLNSDQLVEDMDFVVFASAYDTLDCADTAMPLGCPADLNHDGIVEDSDFVLFAAAYDALLCE